MALIKCSECGKEISDKAVACPHCGCPVSEMTTIQSDVTTSFKEPINENASKVAKKKNKPLPFIIIGGIIAIAVVAILISSLTGGEKGDVASYGISKVTDGKITGGTETELAIIIDILYLSRDDVISVFPNAQDEETKIIIPGTFAGSTGIYKAFFSSDGNHFDQMIFERDSDEYDSDAVVDELCEYLGDYSEYDSEWNEYDWLTDDLELSFYVDERVYFYETSSIIKNNSNEINDENNASNSENNAQSEEDRYALVEKYISEGNYEDALGLLYVLEKNEKTIEQEKECYYQLAIQSLNTGEKVEAYIVFSALGDYKDAATKTQEATANAEEDFYELGVEYYQDGNYPYAKLCLSACCDYEDAQEYLSYIQMMNDYQGVYEVIKDPGINPWKYLVLEGNQLTVYDFFGNNAERTTHEVAITKHYTAKGEKLCIDSVYGGGIIWYYLVEVDGELQLNEQSIGLEWSDPGEFYKKVEDTTKAELDAEYYGTERAKEPAIGMTADEVEKSTWGAPFKKNVRTYEWGTTEQWVYFGDRYIYLENGIVTSISE